MFIKSFTSIVSLLFSVSVSANIAIIVNKDFSETVDKNYVKRIYLGKEQLFPSGSKIMILEMDNDSNLFVEFSGAVVDKKPERYKAYIARQIFTGKMPPIQRVSSANEMKELVAKDKTTIGYIASSEVDDSIKVIASY